jgi:phosphoribosylaminoimidazolecarboxamide formyltransferase/IMP cyclohydrolase
MIHAGLLAVRGDAEHMRQVEELGAGLIDIVVVNLYPFKSTMLKEGVAFEECVENIDIGGPSMLRAAAKNFQDVAVVTDPRDYGRVLDELKNGGVTAETKLAFAAKVFAHTANYDAMIAAYLAPKAGAERFPETLTLTYERAATLRYGENPHQSAAFYREVAAKSGDLVNARQLHGKELSYNNISDTNGALGLLKEFDEPAVVAVKHATPCGVGVGANIFEAFCKAYDADPVSIFGGIIVANREIDEQTAARINGFFTEIVLAPSFSGEAFKILSSKKNIRLLTLDINSGSCGDNAVKEIEVKKVSGGLLIQDADDKLLYDSEFKVVTKRAPSENELKDMLFAWRVVKYVKSNAIVVAKNGQMLGAGSGQVNRIWATQQAITHAADNLGSEILNGAALASDAYFPFSDCVEEAAKAGITAIIQPGGSIRDEESIKKCDELGIAMMFTGMRHFRH